MSQVALPVLNARILEQVNNNDITKLAAASSEVTRTQLREDSFAFKILPPELATSDMLVPSLQHDKPQIYMELEADSPGAKWVPFQSMPEGEYMYGSRYVIPLARVVTPKFEKDIDELHTYKQDLRKVLTENSIKDGLREIDGKFMSMCRSIVEDTVAKVAATGAYESVSIDAWEVDQAGAKKYTADYPVQSFTGKIQYEKRKGGLTQDNLADAKKLLPRGSRFPGMEHKFRLQTYVALMNNITGQDLQKFSYNEVGEVATSMFKDGLTMEKVMGMKVLYTHKDDLVKEGEVFLFAAPEFLGKCYYMTDWTMYMKKEAFTIEMFSYWMGGMAIGNIAGVCCVDFGV